MRTLFSWVFLCLAGLAVTACSGDSGSTGSDTSTDVVTINVEDFDVAEADRVVTSLSSDDLNILVNVASLGDKFSTLNNASKIALMEHWTKEALKPVITQGNAGLLKRVEVAVVSVEDMNEYGLTDKPFDLIALVEFRPEGDVLKATNVQAESRRLEALLQAMKVSTTFEQDTGLFADFDSRLNIPETYYLVEGRPQKFYFESMILAEDIDYYYYLLASTDVPFEYKLRQRYIEFFPQAGDAGTYQFSVNIYTGEYKRIAVKTFKIVVEPDACSVETNVNSLVIGHSISTSWPLLWANKFRTDDNINLSTLGGQEFVWQLPGTTPDMYEGVFLEASSGFNLYHILRKNQNPEGYDPIKAKQQLKSPFIFQDDQGNFAIDMARYKREVLQGKDLDIVILNIGDNDAFNLDLDNPAETIDRVKTDAVALMNHLREITPDVTIGYMMPLNYSHNLHNWKLDYKGNYQYWEQKQKRHLFIKAIRELQAERQDFQIIPTDFSVDGANDYPNFSALHPPTEPTSDYAEQIYAWTLHNACSE